MLQALDTGHPMINGYSGFFPKDHGRLRQQLVGFPDERSLAALRDRHVRYVVIDTDRYDDFDQRIARQLGYDEIVRDHDAVGAHPRPDDELRTDPATREPTTPPGRLTPSYAEPR